MTLDTYSVQPSVLMIGTDPDSKGGISSVIRMYREGGLFKNALYLAAYKDGSAWNKSWFYVVFLCRYLKILLLQRSIRLVHIHTASNFSFLRKSMVVLVAKLFQKKVILHIHGAEFILFYKKGGWLVKTWIRFIFNHCDCLLALSKEWQKSLRDICENVDIRIVYNPTIIQPKSESECIDNSPVKFLFMGRIGKRKGVYDIVRSLQYVDADNIQIQFYGDGELELLRDLIQKNTLQSMVQIRGWIDGPQKESAFRQADVLILPSYNEGLPISVLEAMSYGLPVLATDVGGIAEAVLDGKNGYLIQPGEFLELADRMERLANSVSLRRRMGQFGYELAKTRFALPVIVEQLELLHREFTKS